MRRSRYQLWLRSTKRSRARALTVSGASPGGTPRHFCVPLYAMSTPQPSISTGIPPSDVTQSTSSSASPLPRAERLDVVAHAGRGLGVHDGDDLRRRVRVRRAAAGRSAGPTRPRRARPRHRSATATSHMRSPNTPLTPTTTTSPGSTKFTNAASIPAEPVPLIGSVSSLSVRNTARRRSHVSSSSARKSGSRCPSSGRANASATSG